uniref:Transposase n=1 Tax=Panagrellus redivivus TaxID=6233 RepID=A0A7E4W2M7_PANRE
MPASTDDSRLPGMPGAANVFTDRPHGSTALPQATQNDCVPPNFFVTLVSRQPARLSRFPSHRKGSP